MKSSYRIFKNSPSRSKYLLLIGALAILVIGLITLEKLGHINLFGDKKPSSQISQGEVNLNPPTEEDKKAVDEQKEAIVKQQESGQTVPASKPAQPTSTNKRSVKPVIVSASGGELRSFVPGITENGGTCTARFTRGAQAVSKVSQAFADAQNTICTPINYGDTAVSSGWNVAVTYQSVTSEGTSDASTTQ